MRMAYKSIDQYGIIGDMSSAALVGTDGSIDWCCFPRFDSPSVFAAMLDESKGGFFKISPADSVYESSQSYVEDTNVLRTEFRTSSGVMSVTDFMPMKNGDSKSGIPHEVHRIVRCESGVVNVSAIFEPRLDYAKGKTLLSQKNEAIIAKGNRQTLTLCVPVPVIVGEDSAVAEFGLTQGEEVAFVLAYGSKKPVRACTYKTSDKLAYTTNYWQAMAKDVSYDGMWRDEVIRSFLLLQLMIYEPTGAIVAAPTTSLPEGIGGSRTWDYRFGWLRDSSFTMGALYRMGQTQEADRYLNWLIHQCKVTNGDTRIVYGVSPSSCLEEITLDHLEGYKQSSPVRIGNDAESHLQLDVFGEVILGIDTLYRNGGGVTDEAWHIVEHFADIVCEKWHLKDRGVWETRGPQQHYVYSKLMCWTGLDRAVYLAEVLGRSGSVDEWKACADKIKAEILQEGWDSDKRSFVQRYGHSTLDASNMMIPFVGFLPPNDPRVLSTLDAIMNELADGPFVNRYNTDETLDGLDGQPEGAFIILSFWLIGNLIYTGQIEKAREYFEQVLACANHLGLFAEMVDPRSGEFLGNFPQAYSHIGLIHTARNLSRAISGQPLSYSEHMAAAD